MTRPWYPFYWSDYSGKTQHLTQGEHGAYILLMRYIYTTGKPIPENLVYRVAQATLEQEIKNVDSVLSEFFYLKGGWRQKNVDKIMNDADEKHKKLVESGSKGGKARLNPPLSQAQATLKGASSIIQPQPDIEIEIRPTPIANDFHLPDWVPKAEWDDYLSRRVRLAGADNSKASLNALVAKLMNLQMMGHDPKEILIEATAGGWKTLHSPKGQINANNTRNAGGAASQSRPGNGTGAVGSRSIHQPSRDAAQYRDQVLADIVREREARRNSGLA